MKNVIKILSSALLLLLIVSSCKKEDNKYTYEGGTAPVLSASQTGVIPVSFATKDEEAIKFTWTNPNYKFNSGISSQDVSYTLEIEELGRNFQSTNKKSIVISKELSTTIKQSELNDILLNQLGYTSNVESQIEVRLVSSMANNSVPLVSNVLTFRVTPYAIPPKVIPPGTAPDYADGRLFMVGNATPGGWNNPVPEPSQEFTRISATLYELVVPITGGNSYLLLPVNGSWNTKYGFVGSNNTNNTGGDDFKNGGGDILAPASSGTYKIVVDFQRGKFTVTLQ